MKWQGGTGGGPYYAQSPTRYWIKVSSDGVTWTNVVDHTATSYTTPVFSGNETLNAQGRYLRLESTWVNDGTGWALSFYEFWAEGPTAAEAPPSVVRTITGAYPGPSFVWDGKNDSGVVQANGTYIAEVTAVNGSVSVTVASSPIALDTLAPTVSIVNPTEGSVVSNVYQTGTTINASAADTNFAGWTLEAGSGLAPSAYALLASGASTLSPTTAVLWPSAMLGQGDWTIRLSGSDLAGNIAKVYRHVTKRDFSASQTASSGDAVFQFNPAIAPMSYMSVLPISLRETIEIRNEAGQLVRTLVNGLQRSAGTYYDAWDGRADPDQQGNPGARVPDGAYSYKVFVTDGTASFTWDRSAFSRSGAGVLRMSTGSQFAPYDNIPLEVNYELLAPQKVLFQVSSSTIGQSLVLCGELPAGARCMEQRYRPSGAHKVYWVGTNTDGTPIPNVTNMRVAADRFPENVTVLYGSEPVMGALEVNPAFMSPAVGAVVRFPLTLLGGQTATVVVRLIRHENGATVRTITAAGLPGGQVGVAFDGRADNGLRIPAGHYTVAVTVTDLIGNVVTRHALMTARY